MIAQVRRPSAAGIGCGPRSAASICADQPRPAVARRGRSSPPSAPERDSAACARRRGRMSPLTITGNATASRNRAAPRPSRPRRCRTAARVRPCTVTICAPASRLARASSGRVATRRPSRAASSRSPARGARATTASIRRSARSGVAHQRRARRPPGDSLGRAAHVDVDDLGRPRLASRSGGLLHRSCGLAAGELHDMRSPSRIGASFRTISWWPVASASLAIISDTTRPAPNRSASRRDRQVGYAGHRGQKGAVGPVTSNAQLRQSECNYSHCPGDVRLEGVPAQ